MPSFVILKHLTAGSAHFRHRSLDSRPISPDLVYYDYFHLREAPFSIAPDPSYLYMSLHHQEALGHLLYGTGQYGGFVQLTGEVGTGKTTIVRTMLAQKLGEVDIAILHNPRQSEREFVASICDELGVSYPPEATLKTLVDALNVHLLRVHAAGRRTVLIIDEAQNLEPGVLEQVRLLTNLETDKEKLLRILLVGQPELSELLGRADLRQLASRITARYHLLPLGTHETREYILHRLRVAGGSPDLFTPAAIARVHRLSGGIPRQINILCDRALLGAYSTGARQVSPQIVDQAAREVLGDHAGVLSKPRRVPLAWLRKLPLMWVEGVVVALTMTVLGVLTYRLLSPSHPAVPASAPATATPTEPSAGTNDAARANPAADPAAAPAATTNDSGEIGDHRTDPPAPLATAAPLVRGSEVLGTLRRDGESLTLLTARLIGLWDDQFQINAGENICTALQHDHLECYRGTTSWDDLRQINRAAILTLNLGDGKPFYALLRDLGEDDAVLFGSHGERRYALQDLDPLWSGEFFLLWRRPWDAQQLTPGAHGEGVRWLRRQLAEAAGEHAPARLSDRFDSELVDTIRQFQNSRGLDPDGQPGIRLLNTLEDLTHGETPVPALHPPATAVNAAP